jgi:hypothetical protein
MVGVGGLLLAHSKDWEGDVQIEPTPSPSIPPAIIPSPHQTPPSLHPTLLGRPSSLS